MNNLFFELIQVAIGTRICLSHTPSADEWGELYKMAKKQSLVGVCFAGVQKLQMQRQEPPEMLYLRWIGMAAKIQQRNEVVNRQCVELQKKLICDGHRNYIMKGQGNAAIYRAAYDPSTSLRNQNDNENLCLLRQSGDIDVYLEGGLDKVLAYAKTFGETKQVNELEMHVDVFPDTEVEFHYMPFFMRSPIRNKRLQEFFESKKVECFANKIALPNGVGEIVSPTIEFNLVHQLVHIYHHFITEGVGFRQLMDYYFVLRTVSTFDSAQEHSSKFQKVSGGSNVLAEPVEVREVKKVVSGLGLDRFASALMWVIAYVFEGNSHLEPAGDDETLKPFETASWMLWEPCEKDGRMLLEEILKSGNFGHQDETKADLSNKWKSFWYVNGKTFRFWRFDHWAWFWSPLWRLYHFAWRKINGYK